MIHKEENGRISTDWKGGFMQSIERESEGIIKVTFQVQAISPPEHNTKGELKSGFAAIPIFQVIFLRWAGMRCEGRVDKWKVSREAISMCQIQVIILGCYGLPSLVWSRAF